MLENILCLYFCACMRVCHSLCHSRLFFTSSHSFLMGNVWQFFASYDAKNWYSGKLNDSIPSQIEPHVLMYCLYLQLRRCVTCLKVSFDDDWNKLLCYFKFTELVRKASAFYEIMAESMYGHYNHLRQIWERDLNSNIQEEAWEAVVFNAGWPVRDALSKFTHYKVIHRYYYTPV